MTPHVVALPRPADDADRAPRRPGRLEVVDGAGEAGDEVGVEGHVGVDERPSGGAVEPQQHVVEGREVGRERVVRVREEQRLHGLLERLERAEEVPVGDEAVVDDRGDRDPRRLRHAGRLDARGYDRRP